MTSCRNWISCSTTTADAVICFMVSCAESTT
ncbi:Protein of unknown function [Lactobacillus delbrueckii subsp. lactis]|nr:Protein of unknown function [Lactobacillus delbrueckii subsp. lactis]CDR84499.1 Protein of unknown function [Lactobacillus delbrueckii subsp. lactis]CDR85119.1 Protein of unknown function [Lactobacillus delbrueckii subsp. lactis]